MLILEADNLSECQGTEMLRHGAQAGAVMSAYGYLPPPDTCTSQNGLPPQPIQQPAPLCVHPGDAGGAAKPGCPVEQSAALGVTDATLPGQPQLPGFSRLPLHSARSG